jgi:penicillin-binding protein 2
MIRHDKLKDLHREKETFAARTIVAGCMALLMAATLSFRLFDLQVLQQSYYSTRADENRMRLSAVAPVRGLIYDRNGAVLAQNTPAFVLELIPEEVKQLDDTLLRLSKLVRLEDLDIARFKDRVRKTPRYRAVPLRTNLSLEEVAKFEINRYDFDGVDVTAGLTRSYPLGNTAAHVVGYVGGITEDELRRAPEPAYRGLSQMGKVGVEKSHEDVLRGESGAKVIEANAYGRPLRELDYQQGKPGRNLILTLDAKVQMIAEQALGDYNGAIVAIDPRNGEIIAMVSKPGFNPHLFGEGIDGKTYKALLDDPNRPLYNRALQGTYPPGSTIKPFMALAGLEYDVIDANHRETCNGQMSLAGSSRKYRCWKRHGHGSLDMAEGVARSCDIYFYNVAINLGIDRIQGFLDQFGLGRVTNIDLPLEKAGLLPSRDWKRRARKESWYPGETLNVGIGQGYLTVTPMQLAQITARMAMRGDGYKPHLVRATQDPISLQSELIALEPLPTIQNRHRADWETVVQAMQQVTQVQGGTAFATFRDAAYTVAGKTGSAQVAGLKQDEKVAPTQESLPLNLRDHALFVAFAPADNPQIAVGLIAEHGGHGASVAAPVARQIMDQYLLGEIRYRAPGSPPLVTAATAAVAAPAPAVAIPQQPVPAEADVPATEDD